MHVSRYAAVPFVIVIVNSRFLERPQKRSRENQLIHRRLTRTKSLDSGQNPESQAGRQSDGYGGWCLELRRGGRDGEDYGYEVEGGDRSGGGQRGTKEFVGYCATDGDSCDDIDLGSLLKVT